MVAAWLSALSWDIVDAMLTVKEPMLSPAGTVAEPRLTPLPTRWRADELDDDELQAAAVRRDAAAASTTRRPARRKRPKRAVALPIGVPGLSLQLLLPSLHPISLSL